jgi:hypothetical protein
MPRGGWRPGAGRKRKHAVPAVAPVDPTFDVPPAIAAKPKAPKVAAPPKPGPPPPDTLTATVRREAELRQLEQQAREQLQRSMQHNDKQLRAYAALGTLPEDPLAGVDYTLRVLQQSLVEVLCDNTLSAKERRAEQRQVARAMLPLLPVSRLYAAEKKIRDAENAQNRETRDPALTPAPTGSQPLQMD